MDPGKISLMPVNQVLTARTKARAKERRRTNRPQDLMLHQRDFPAVLVAMPRTVRCVSITTSISVIVLQLVELVLEVAMCVLKLDVSNRTVTKPFMGTKPLKGLPSDSTLQNMMPSHSQRMLVSLGS